MMSLQTFDRSYSADVSSRFGRSSLLSAESLRRLAWSTFYSDAIVDGGRYGFHTVDENAYRLQLPCEETSFLGNDPVRTEPLFPSTTAIRDRTGVQAPAPIGISGHLIRTAAARRRALHFAFRASHREMPPAELEAEATALESLIDAVIVSLPPRYHFTIDNVHLHRDCLPAFILLHLFRHNLYIILGRARLMIYQQAADRSHLVPQLRRDRIARALPMAGIVAEGLKVGANFCPQVGVQAYVALESASETLTRLGTRDSGPGPSH
jgi:hypothetical protein